MTERGADWIEHVVTVFGDGAGGGNPAPIVLGADAMTDEQMQAVARRHGHEAAFVLAPTRPDCDLALRFWVPNHEMSMCGHATVGAVWLLARHGRLPRDGELRVQIASGVVRARLRDGEVTISQPPGRVEAVAAGPLGQLLAALRLSSDELAAGPVRNATTSRTKTLVPVRDPRRLDAIIPDFDQVEAACAALDSTGLYPYAPSGPDRFDARQFPRSSGYPEDPATGVAAAALAFGLLADGLVPADDRPLTVRQGRAMGRPSRITVRFAVAAGVVTGCWLGGPVALS